MKAPLCVLVAGDWWTLACEDGLRPLRKTGGFGVKGALRDVRAMGWEPALETCSFVLGGAYVYPIKAGPGRPGRLALLVRGAKMLYLAREWMVRDEADREAVVDCSSVEEARLRLAAMGLDIEAEAEFLEGAWLFRLA